MGEQSMRRAVEGFALRAFEVQGQAGEVEHYVRVRAGASRRTLQTYVSQLGLGTDEAHLAAELLRYLEQLDGEEDPVALLELLERGSQTPVELQRVDVPPRARPASSPERSGAAPWEAMASRLVDKVVELADGYAHLAGAAIIRSETYLKDNRELAERLGALEALSEVEQGDGRSEVMAQAISAFSPLAWAVASKAGLDVGAVLGSAEGAPQLEAREPETASRSSDADRLIAELAAHLEQHPESLTPARLAAVRAAGARALMAQSRAPAGPPSPASPGSGEVR